MRPGGRVNGTSDLGILRGNGPVRPGGYFLVKDYWGCATGWGRIFTTGLIIMGFLF